MRAVKETLRVTVTDGVLNLYFSKGAADNALLSALEVVPVTAARLAGSEDAGEAPKASLYPNPVQDQLTVALGFPASRVRAAAVTDAQGEAHRMSSYRASDAQELSIGTQTLPRGFYLLRLDTRKGSRVLRVHQAVKPYCSRVRRYKSSTARTRDALRAVLLLLPADGKYMRRPVRLSPCRGLAHSFYLHEQTFYLHEQPFRVHKRSFCLHKGPFWVHEPAFGVHGRNFWVIKYTFSLRGRTVGVPVPRITGVFLHKR